MNDQLIFEEDMDDQETATVSRPKKKKKKKKNVLKKVLMMMAYAFGILLVLYLASAIYLWVEDHANRNNAELSGENVEAEQPIYTQTQMDEALEDAKEQAEIEIEDAYAEGVEEGRTNLLTWIMETLVNGANTMDMLRPLYPDRVIVVSNGSFHFVPINTELRLSELKQENVVELESGELQYQVDGEVISHKGIDVSLYQGEINWSQVAEDGVEFAIIRAGYRGYGESGRLVEDDAFERNMNGAIDNNIHAAAYFFTQAITVEEAVEEADLMIEKCSQFGNAFPIAIDVERVAGKNPRMDALTPTERTDVIIAFCERVKEAGFQPMVYYNTEMSILYVELDRLEEYPKWYASYSNKLFYPYYYGIWQYSSTGKVNGISGSVDLNMCFDPFW